MRPGARSTGPKNLSALAEGGLFSTDDDEMAELAGRVRIVRRACHAGRERKYNAYMMGWNYRTDPLQSAFARSQLRRLRR